MSGDNDTVHEEPSTVVAPTTNIHGAKSVDEIKECLVHLREQHDEVTAKLEKSIASHEDLSRHLRRLDLSRARLGSLAVTTRSISHGMLSGAASTAARISDAVELLDLEQSRVQATLRVVEQVAELKSCVLGVVGSMGAPQDWETAAEYINRASRIPDSVIDSGFAEQVVPTAEVPDFPRVTLSNAAQSLCQLFLREFERAVDEANGAKITRFFKMFPLIGRSKEGLDAYGRYVCQGVALRARARLQTGPGSDRQDGSFYSNALTKLFEHIAQVIDGHSPLVEQHYGAGTMIKVMERLHREADVQGGIVLDTWSDERAIDRKLTDVKSYAYSFLVQSFLPTQKSFTGTPRTQSPAIGNSGNSSRTATEEGIEMKEVDRLLNEAGAMLGHWSLYLRFIASRATTEEETETNGHKAHNLTSPAFIINSNLPKKISKTLIDPFNTFATFFLRRSVERSFQLDETPSGLSLSLSKPITANQPHITSAVDDIMYVVRQVLQRALGTAQVDIVTSVTSTIGRVLGTDFIGMIQRKMRDESYPKPSVQGAMPADDKVIAFLVLINNLDVATDYVKRIVHAYRHDLDDEAPGDQGSGNRPLEELFPMDRDSIAVRNALKILENSFTAKATELVNEGLSVAFREVVKPRMRPLLTDAFRETDYSVTDSSYYENRDNETIDGGEDEPKSVKARTQPAWEQLTRPMKRILTERNFEKLLSITLANFSHLLERRIWSYYARVSEPGAVALEKDIVDVVQVAVRGETFKHREIFNKCLKIVEIMNLEDDEWDHINRGGDDVDAAWLLNADDRLRARTIVKGRD